MFSQSGAHPHNICWQSANGVWREARGARPAACSAWRAACGARRARFFLAHRCACVSSLMRLTRRAAGEARRARFFFAIRCDCASFSMQDTPRRIRQRNTLWFSFAGAILLGVSVSCKPQTLLTLWAAACSFSAILLHAPTTRVAYLGNRKALPTV